jgi:hypothetical protein
VVEWGRISLTKEEEGRLVARMLELVRQHPRYGYRWVWALLRREGCAESFNSKARDELLNAEEFASLLEARVLGKEWKHEYNQVRPHSSLGYRTPAEFGASCPRADSAALRRPEDMTVTVDPTLTPPGT